MSKKLLRKKLALMLATLKKKRKYYCECEYLESTGTQYIDTGVLPVNDMEFECKFTFTSLVNTNLTIVGSRDGEKRCQPIGAYNSKWSASIGGSYDANGTSVSANTPYIIKSIITNGQTITTNVNGSQASTCTSTTGLPSQELYIFARNFYGNPDPADSKVNGRLYFLKIKANGVLVRDLIPVLDWDMTPCMYDRVTEQLFYNQGTGSFSVGRQIHPVEYLESTGTQYILTGFTPTVDTDFELELSSTKTSTNWAMGCPTWVGVHYKGADGQIGVTNSSTSDFQQYVNYARDNTRITMKLQGNTVYANGVSLGTITRRAGTLDFALFGYRDANRGATLLFSGSIYKCTIWDNDILVRDFIPMVDELGVGAMFDRVSHTIYDNAGTGAFGYSGREVEYLQSDGARAIVAGLTVDDTCGYDVKWMALNSNDTIILGTKGSGDSRWVLSGGNNPNVNISWNTSSGGVGLGLNKIQTAQMNYFNDRKRILNDTPLTDITQTLSANASTYSVGIFGGYWGASTISLYSTCRIYYAKISKGTGLVRDFVPMFKDGSPCLFDKIGGLYYFGTGTGSFTTGKIVEPEYE